MKHTSFYLTVVLLLMVQFINGQFVVPKLKDVQSLEGRTLIVCLREPDEKTLRDFKKKPDEAEAYKKRIEVQNSLFKQSFEKYWKVKTKDFIIETQSKAQELAWADKNQKYVLLSADFDTEMFETVKTRRYVPVYMFKLQLSEKKIPLFRVSFPIDLLSELDYKFAFHSFEKYINAGYQELKNSDMWDVDGNLKILADKTLVLAKPSLGITEAEIGKVYPNKVEVVESTDIIDERALSANNNFIYMGMIWSNVKQQKMFVAIDASTMDVVGVLGTGQFEFKVGLPIGLRIANVYTYRTELMLDNKHLKYLADRRAMDMNN